MLHSASFVQKVLLGQTLPFEVSAIWTAFCWKQKASLYSTTLVLILYWKTWKMQTLETLGGICNCWHFKSLMASGCGKFKLLSVLQSWNWMWTWCTQSNGLCCPGAKASPFLISASTARHLYLRGGVGVGSMIKIYGGRKRNGVCPSHFSVGSKNVARKVLQALEALKMVEKDPNG